MTKSTIEAAFKVIEVTGVSSEGQDAAIAAAIDRASQTLENLSWYELIDSRGSISGGTVAQYQVTLKIGFKLN